MLSCVIIKDIIYIAYLNDNYPLLLSVLYHVLCLIFFFDIPLASWYQDSLKFLISSSINLLFYAANRAYKLARVYCPCHDCILVKGDLSEKRYCESGYCSACAWPSDNGRVSPYCIEEIQV